MNQRPRPRRRWHPALVVGVAVVVLYCAVVLGLQRTMLFPRSYAAPLPDGGAVPGLVRLVHDSDEGPVEAYLLPGDGVDATNPGPVVLFAHGNGEIIDYWTRDLAPYRRMGVSVFLPEFRGYGRSAGAPSEAAIASDFLAFHDMLVARPEVDPERIVFHGRSLGGGAVCGLSRQRPPTAMILQSTFESVPAVARKWFIPSFLILDRFDNIGAVRGYDAKLLIIHGRNDTLIPISHGEALRDAARDARMVVFSGGHNDTPSAAEEDDYWSAVRQLLVESGILSGT